MPFCGFLANSPHWIDEPANDRDHSDWLFILVTQGMTRETEAMKVSSNKVKKGHTIRKYFLKNTADWQDSGDVCSALLGWHEAASYSAFVAASCLKCVQLSDCLLILCLIPSLRKCTLGTVTQGRDCLQYTSVVVNSHNYWWAHSRRKSSTQMVCLPLAVCSVRHSCLSPHSHLVVLCLGLR